MANVDEAGLVGSIIKALKTQYPRCWIFKVVGSPYQEPGMPDLLICVDGLLVGAEIKFPRPGESLDHARSRATPQQINQIARINAAGGVAGVAVSVEEVLAMVARAYDRHR